MKNINFLIFCICVTAFFSCDEDEIRPLIQSNNVPDPIENVVVENVAGGATLTYNLPDETDLLYVEAEFRRQDGAELSRVRSSVFNNSLDVNGFGIEKDFEVTLYAVNQSQNRSTPITTTIRPEKAPLQFVCESLTAVTDFGGMIVNWENPFEADISLEISTINEFGEPELVDVVYTTGLEGTYVARGFESVETTFEIIIKDRFGNVLPAKSFTLTPLFEEEADRINYATVIQLHDTPTFNFRWGIDNVIDGDLQATRFQAYLSAGGWIDPDGELPEYEGLKAHIITIDAGVEIQLSRIRLHSTEYTGSCPRFFDIWGTNQLNADGSLDGWTKIVDNGETVKPSGLPVGQNTAEDIDTAARGYDILPLPLSPSVRYIRFVNKASWDETTTMTIAELRFFGKIID